ncbi:uncharacterized protein LOC110415651 [Herrania umbratica]|uniref:Uncharacterized protein LOC110415651 n=1 Tax=Herrania umbratica TaxID=108875 RepID=A0A6J1A798_9ROSI|nr:uncharacterized protein LOC110415651 [Herrania umbratica]
MATIRPGLQQSAQKALPGSANLANLLPTGTVFEFQALIISFSNNGNCEMAHMCMTLALGAIILCSLTCSLSSFTDSFIGEDGKLYCGVATLNGHYVFNDELIIACSSFDVQGCFLPEPWPNVDALVANLPLAAGILASGLFMLFPTKRKGIGYADKPDHGKGKEEPDHHGNRKEESGRHGHGKESLIIMAMERKSVRSYG